MNYPCPPGCFVVLEPEDSPPIFPGDVHSHPKYVATVCVDVNRAENGRKIVVYRPATLEELSEYGYM